jgi:hypothetical protein
MLGEKPDGLTSLKRYNTRSEINEICIKYLEGRCFRHRHCLRIHPVDKARIYKILCETSDASSQQPAPPISAEILINSKGPEHELPSLSNSSAPTVKLPGSEDTGSYSEDLASSNITTLNLSVRQSLHPGLYTLQRLTLYIL